MAYDPEFLRALSLGEIGRAPMGGPNQDAIDKFNEIKRATPRDHGGMPQVNPSIRQTQGQNYWRDVYGAENALGMDTDKAVRAMESENRRAELMDPMGMMRSGMDIMWGAPGMARATEGYNQATDQASQALGKGAGFYQNMARGGGPSYVNQAANAQRMQAEQSIGRQAAMGSRGSMNPAAQRAAIMGASGVQSNMAAQVAAARAQERQQAMQNYMNAKMGQADVRGQAFDRFGNYNTTGAKAGAGAHQALGDTMANVDPKKVSKWGGL